MSKKIKKDRFKKNAIRRTNNILDKIHTLGHCSNRNIYEYSQDDIDAIFSKIEAKLNVYRSKFVAELDKKHDNHFVL